MSEEIDIALNKAMYRFLEMGVANSFQDTQINLSHVAALIQKNKKSDVYRINDGDPMYEEHILSAYSVLPPDFYWLVNGRAEVVTSTVDCDTAPTIAVLAQNEYVAVLPFAMPTAATTTAPYFAKVEIGITSPASLIYSSPYDANNAIHTNFNSKKSKYVLIGNILEKFYKHPTIKFYWERYRNAYYKDSFVVVSTTNPLSISMLVYDPNRTTVNNVTSATFVPANYNIYNRGLLGNLQNAKVAIAPITTTEATDTYKVLKQNPFYKTRSREVVAEVDHDFLRVYRDESFIVARVIYDYIRKPRTISLALNQSCELADTTHNKIVDLAVEILRLDTKDPAYPQSVQDTQNRTINN